MMQRLEKLSIRWAAACKRHGTSFGMCTWNAVFSLVFFALWLFWGSSDSPLAYLSIMFAALSFINFERSGFVLLLQRRSEEDP